MSPEFPTLNRAELWLATIRRQIDTGATLRESVETADEALGFTRTPDRKAA